MNKTIFRREIVASTQKTKTIFLRLILTLQAHKHKIILGTIVSFLGFFGLSMLGFNARYKAEDMMSIKLTELSNSEYPENPAALAEQFSRYSQRKLKIIKQDDTHFNFVLEPTDNKTAKIIIKNVDLKLLTPKIPESVKRDRGLTIIALTDREWNRQQVSFSANSQQIEIIGGDGFEKENLYEIALANNCLNAGYWEVLLFTKKKDRDKTLYYQSWFTFPRGHYKNVFETVNNISYWQYLWRLERWQDPKGTLVNPNLLRKVINEGEVKAKFPLDEKIIVAGEQSRKIRTTLATNLRTWRDFYSDRHEIKFATFQPPGFYNANKPWGNQYYRIGKFEKAILRNIQPVGIDRALQEIELTFSDTKTGEQNRLFFSGIDLQKLPQLPQEKYASGLYMPMGIGIPPFYQNYAELTKNPPSSNPYFSVLLDSKNKWINHHELALDGVALHLDRDNPKILHLYLLSYERNTLIAHFSMILQQ